MMHGTVPVDMAPRKGRVMRDKPDVVEDKEPKGSDDIDRITRLVERAGSADSAIARLLGENAEYRSKLRDMERELEQVRAKVPGDGARVLVGDDATAFEAYKSLGAPDEVARKMADLQEQVFTTGRAVRVQQAAEVLGYDADVLGSLARGADGKLLDVVVKDETVERDGKQVAAKVPYLLVGDKEQALGSYAEQHWSKFMPSLKRHEQQRSETRLPQQARTEGKAADDKLGSFYRAPKLAG